VLLRKKGRSPGEVLRGDKVRTTARVLGGSVRLEIAPCLLTRYQRVGKNLAIERELFGCCRHPIQYRERSDRMPAQNQRFKSSCDYRVPASGRFARGTVLGGDHVSVPPHSTDFSQSLYRAVVLMTSLNSNRPFLSNTLMEHHRILCRVDLATYRV